MKHRLLSFMILGLVQILPLTSGLAQDKLTISGSFRSRAEAWNWFQGDAGDNNYLYSGNLLRMGLSQRHRDWNWNAEFAVPLLMALPRNASGPGVQGRFGVGGTYSAANDGSRNATLIFPKQLYVEFTRTSINSSHTLKVGRFEFLDGTEVTPTNQELAAIKRQRVSARLIGNFGFTHVGRSFDGVQFDKNGSLGNFAFVAGTPTRGVFQVDGWGWNKTAFAYAAHTSMWGRDAHAAETRVFAIYYHDWRRVLKTDNRPSNRRSEDFSNIRVATFGFHTIHTYAAKPAIVDFLFWGTLQTGRWGTQVHRAHAMDVEAGFQPHLVSSLRPWLRAGFYLGSGDDNPNDARHETFFQVLPTPRLFARFPFFNMMNNQDAFGILVLRPHGNVTISSEFHSLRLDKENDLWYSGGGVFQPWSFGYAGRATSKRRSLANLYDASVEYRINPKVTWTGYFGYAQGMAAIKEIYPHNENGSFGYLEISYRF